jgi:hypothetical protein
LCKEVNGRYCTVSELLADLKGAREQLANPAVVKPEAATRHSRVKPAMVWGVLLLLVIAVVGTMVYRRSVSRRQFVASETIAPIASPRKLYTQMSERERLDFVAEQEQRISGMMGDRPVKLDDNAVRLIKTFVDRYVSNMDAPASDDSGSTKAIYARARPYVPLIARSFAARKVPVIIGIYLPVIESGYRPCYESSFGANGLYQFMPSTARHYGISRDDMCNVEKMTPAAAHYIADHMAELGEDAQSMTLVLLSYNRGAQWVRDSLRRVRGTENYARNFWTLLAHRDALDPSFRNETAGYVPSFIAAAIIGENPEVFGLQGPALSALAKVE